ncbi:MAG: DUF4351 domain-containing protein [Thermosynechococcaceae cyanobacterium]
MVLRQLQRQIGAIPAGMESQINALDLPHLTLRAEALLDFSQPSDLTAWLQR